MQLITIKKTNYGYRAETVSKSIPNEKQLKKVDRFIRNTGLQYQN